MFQVVLQVWVFLTVGVAVTTALDPFINFKEGNCSGMTLRPVKADREFLDTLPYLSAGNKYSMFQIATQMPTYRSMTDDEFYYDACYSRNTTTNKVGNLTASVYGFGRPLFRFHIAQEPGIYLENIPTDPLDSWDTTTEIVTLTDGKTFAFIVNCWNGVEERAWGLLTLEPSLDSHLRTLIEEHAAGLGFKKENFVFLRYDSCRWDEPVFDDDSLGSHLKEGHVTPEEVEQFHREVHHADTEDKVT